MGIKLIDNYSLLHFAMGIICYFWGMPLHILIVLHIIFEIIENTPEGINFINKYIKIWPGGKDHPDTIINSIGDIISSIVGWILAYKISQ